MWVTEPRPAPDGWRYGRWETVVTTRNGLELRREIIWAGQNSGGAIFDLAALVQGRQGSYAPRTGLLGVAHARYQWPAAGTPPVDL